MILPTDEAVALVDRFSDEARRMASIAQSGHWENARQDLYDYIAKLESFVFRTEANVVKHGVYVEKLEAVAKAATAFCAMAPPWGHVRRFELLEAMRNALDHIALGGIK